MALKAQLEEMKEDRKTLEKEVQDAKAHLTREQNEDDSTRDDLQRVNQERDGLQGKLRDESARLTAARRDLERLGRRGKRA